MSQPINAREATPTISVVSPVYGCAGCLEDLVDQLGVWLESMGLSHEVILVDDASPDGSWKRITKLASTRHWLRGLRMSRNFGQHSAISAGIEHSRGEWVVVLDCDLQDPPNAIPVLYGKAIKEELDIVFAQRRNRKDHWPKRAASWLFFRILSWLTDTQQDPSTANYGIYNRRVIQAVCGMPEKDRSFPLLVKWTGFKTGYVEIEHAPRSAGSSGYTLRKLVKLALSISLSYSEKPLIVVAASGIFCAMAAFVMAIVAVWRWYGGDIEVAGYTSLLASIWLVGGLLLLGLGVVGLYVGQVFRNVQGRPYYIIAEDTDK